MNVVKKVIQKWKKTK